MESEDKRMKLMPIFIGILVFSGVMIAMAGYYNDIYSVYSPTNTSSLDEITSFNQSFDKMTELSALVSNHTTGASTKPWFDISKYQDITALFFDVGAIMGTGVNILINFVTVMFPYALGLPPWMSTMILTIIITVFALSIAAWFMKRDEL